MRSLGLVLACLLLAAVAACSATSPQPAQASAAPAPAPAATPGSSPRSAAVPPQLDLSCRTDADCTVKNVGNCCGAAPSCVNVDSPTDPAAVMAQCQASGRMSVCGFAEITGCQCVDGQCAARQASADTLRRPIDTTEPVR
ncbi:MAG TPA: hypothetical protein VD865_13250 [Stenotrophomonas sp.]|nr:hypothetical protein [Stenotrophomonas sp.]